MSLEAAPKGHSISLRRWASTLWACMYCLKNASSTARDPGDWRLLACSMSSPLSPLLSIRLREEGTGITIHMMVAFIGGLQLPRPFVDRRKSLPQYIPEIHKNY
ncbi:hypothetical protein DFH09DRAFT_1084322 [Mycena vulgaris]|nr:hypothetical protein DFH09DRAFT_1084322 [Mycena vulgaris]